MNQKRNLIYNDVQKLIAHHGTRDPRTILQERNVTLIPFKEMTRYEIGSYKFMKNIVGNILLFVPFGFFASYYLNNKKASVITIVTLIVSGCAEGMQYYLGRVFDIDDIILNVLGGIVGYLLYIGLMAIKGKLPKFMKSDAFINLVIIILVILIICFSFDIDLLSYIGG